jgi:hypothetical protein
MVVEFVLVVLELAGGASGAVLPAAELTLTYEPAAAEIIKLPLS